MKYIIGCWIWIVTITSLRHYITDQEIISDDNDVQTPHQMKISQKTQTVPCHMTRTER